MAFFGLSRLGPQSCLAEKRIEGDTYSVALFTANEFREAFLKVSGGTASLPLARIPDVLSRVFHGPAPLLEGKRVSDAIAAIAEGSISLEAFIQVIVDLQSMPLVFDVTDRHA